MAALPSAIRKAVDKTGQHILPGHAKRDKSQQINVGGAPGEERPQSSGVDTRAWREMRTSPIFDGLPNEALRDALMSGDAHVLRLVRDSLVPMDGSIALVRSGQVASRASPRRRSPPSARPRTPSPQAAARGASIDKKERKRRNEVGPLIRVAEQNLATFEDGDVVETSRRRRQPRHARLLHGHAGAWSSPSQRGRVDLWKRIYPFMADRFRRASQAARAKVEATDGAKSAVADFFIRHGLSVSMTLARAQDRRLHRVQGVREGVRRALRRQAPGHQRAHPRQPRLRRRLPHLHRSALHRSLQLRRDLVRRAAQGGPHQGGRLHRLHAVRDGVPVQRHRDARARRGAARCKLRLNKEGKLGFGDGTPRKAKLRRMASKCDHCAFYEDQACITACPTGALVEILPSDAVTQLPEAARASAKAGYDRTVAIDVNNLNESKAFVKGGLDIPELGRARAPRKQLSLPMWWTLGIGAFLLVVHRDRDAPVAAEVLDVVSHRHARRGHRSRSGAGAHRLSPRLRAGGRTSATPARR